VFQPLLDPKKQYRHFALYGGRGTAKSHSVAEAIIVRSTREPQNIVCGRQFQNSINESSKSLLEQKIFTLGANENFEIGKTEITHKTYNSKMFFIGLERNIESRKSMEGIDIFWNEEAQTTNVKSLAVTVPTFLRKKNSQLIWTWNPRFKDDPVDDMFRGPNGPPPDSYIRHVTYEDNPFFFATELHQQYNHARLTNKRVFEHVWCGGYDENSDARIFQNVKISRYKVKDHIRPMFGMDFGFSTDPSTIVKCYIDYANKIVYIAYAYFGQGIPLESLPDFIEQVPEARDYTITADSSQPQTIDFLNRKGYRVIPAVKGPGSIKSGLTFLQGFQIYINPDMPEMIEEARRYFWKTDRNGLVLPMAEDKFNHGWDAVRYAVEDEMINAKDSRQLNIFKLR
jgi:phage terminase large subunit